MQSVDDELVRKKRLPIIEVVMIAILFFFVFALFFPTLSDHRYPGLQCGMNLKQIYGAAMMYSQKKGAGFFPIGSGPAPRAHESLNEMIQSEPDLDPRLFVCPEGEATPAARQADGSFRLDEDSLSYAWIAAPTRNTTVNAPLACDKYVDGYTDARGTHHGHHDGVQAVTTDGRVEFLRARDLPPDTALPPGLTR